MIEESGGAAEAGDAHFESHARSQRRLFENQSEKTASQRAAVAVGPRLHVGRQMQQFAHLVGAPFHPVKQIGLQRNRGGVAVAVAIGCLSYLVSSGSSACNGVAIAVEACDAFAAAVVWFSHFPAARPLSVEAFLQTPTSILSEIPLPERAAR